MNKRALNIFAAIVLAVFMLLPAVQPAAAEEGKLQIDQTKEFVEEKERNGDRGENEKWEK